MQEFRRISIGFFAKNKRQFKYHFFKVKIEPEVLKKVDKNRGSKRPKQED